jgi:hypothetical protein
MNNDSVWVVLVFDSIHLLELIERVFETQFDCEKYVEDHVVPWKFQKMREIVQGQSQERHGYTKVMHNSHGNAIEWTDNNSGRYVSAYELDVIAGSRDV